MLQIVDPKSVTAKEQESATTEKESKRAIQIRQQMVTLKPTLIKLLQNGHTPQEIATMIEHPTFSPEEVQRFAMQLQKTLPPKVKLARRGMFTTMRPSAKRPLGLTYGSIG